tara:strand:- start:702 stop:1646 length:945 start_codon:yes stop_codon:yes gene_type:complete
MATMGFRDTIALGNMMNDRVASVNRSLLRQNTLNRQNFRGLNNSAISNLNGMQENQMAKESEERGEEGGTIGKTLMDVGDVVKKGKGIYNKGQATVNTLSNARNTMTDSFFPEGEGEDGTFDNPLSRDDLKAKISDSATRGYILPPDKVTPAEPHTISSPDEAPAGLSEDTGAVGDLGTMGKGLAGLAVLGGAYDVGKDITEKSGTWGKKKGYQKVGDVAGIAGGLAGGLELAGVGMDATVVGAPVGAALGALGAIAGAVSFGTSMYDDLQKDKTSDTAIQKQQTKISKMKAPQLTNPIAERVLGTTGAFVGGA